MDKADTTFLFEVFRSLLNLNQTALRLSFLVTMMDLEVLGRQTKIT